jgi:hypothetical protein
VHNVKEKYYKQKEEGEKNKAALDVVQRKELKGPNFLAVLLMCIMQPSAASCKRVFSI